MSGVTAECIQKLTKPQQYYMEALGDAIPAREWKRIHNPTSLAALDAFLSEVRVSIRNGATSVTTEQQAAYKKLIADGSGEFSQAVNAQLTVEGTPPVPGFDPKTCAMDFAQYACFCSSLAQSNSSVNILVATETAKKSGQWWYVCQDVVLQDKLYQNPLDGLTETTPGTTPGGTTPGGTTPGGTLPGGNTTPGASDPKAAPKDNSKVWLGVGIGAAVLAAGAAAWAFWPKKSAAVPARALANPRR